MKAISGLMLFSLLINSFSFAKKQDTISDINKSYQSASEFLKKALKEKLIPAVKISIGVSSIILGIRDLADFIHDDTITESIYVFLVRANLLFYFGLNELYGGVKLFQKADQIFCDNPKCKNNK